MLFRCAELDKLHAIQLVVAHIMDNLLYSPKLFDAAEMLFAQGQRNAALLLYEGIAEGEKYQHSERLAICQYRLFTIQVGNDQIRNLKAATRFEPFVERLDEIDQLDALKDLANVYRSLHEWDMLYETAQKMRHKAEIYYSMKQRQKKQKSEESYMRLSRPIFVYITYADLLCASVCEAQGNYQQALQFTYAYANLDWVIETDEETRHWINLYEHWAVGNIFVNKLLSGDTSVLPDYVEYIVATLITNEDEKLSMLLNIIIAANRYAIDVDDVLSRFEVEFNSFDPASTDMYTHQVVPEHITLFKYELAKYYLNRGSYTHGFKYLLDVLSKSLTINKEAFLLGA